MVHQVGLVIITIAYQPADLSLIQPSGTFTNDYHRGVGDSQLIWLWVWWGWSGVGYVGL